MKGERESRGKKDLSVYSVATLSLVPLQSERRRMKDRVTEWTPMGEKEK